MKTLAPCVVVFSLAAAACSAPPKAPDSTASASTPPILSAPSTEPRLHKNGEQLYIAHAPAAAIRGELLYVLAHDPLPHTESRKKIGIVKATQRVESTLEVVWYCAPVGADSPEVADGLPVAVIPEDTVARAGHCLGEYTPAAPGNGGADWVDVRLKLGAGDGVGPGDRYALIGRPLVDDVNRRVTDFERLGVCFVQSDGLQALNSVCRLDRHAKTTELTDAELARGGFVLFEAGGKR